jgi:hypothetical protein
MHHHPRAPLGARPPSGARKAWHGRLLGQDPVTRRPSRGHRIFFYCPAAALATSPLGMHMQQATGSQLESHSWLGRSACCFASGRDAVHFPSAAAGPLTPPPPPPPPHPPRRRPMQARSGCPWALLAFMVLLQAVSVAHAQDDCGANEVFDGVECVPGELRCWKKTVRGVPWLRGVGAAGGVALA